MMKVVATGAQNAHAELNVSSEEISLWLKLPMCFPEPSPGKHIR